jgi:shikimate kinase
MLLVLIGLRGSGKTTLAPILAGKLGYQWLDLDAATLAVLGETSVVDAWKHHGENGFRAAEAVALRDALNKTNYVIACGGGTPTAPGATAMLTAAEETGKAAIVYLRGSIETLQQRLRDAGVADRPGLTGADPIAEVPMLFMKRDPLYMSIASCTVAIDGQTVEQTVENLGWMLDATEDEA